LAVTRNLSVFGTVHVPLIHPILAAKQFVTVDHVSRGRFGLNIVCGWNEDEFEMFGQPQREHDMRYAYGQEWLDVVENIWSRDEPFDHHGEFFKLKGVAGWPKPWRGQRPVTMNAGASQAGRSFAARNCDFLFTVLVDLEKSRRDIADIKAQAAAHDRNALEVFTTSYIVCRPTQSEAEDYHRHYAIENGDWTAVEHLRKLQGQHTRGRPPELQQKFRERFAGGHGSFPIIGTPDLVAEYLQRISEAGFAGTTLGFVDYRNELPFFIEHVMPRLERMGLRQSPVAVSDQKLRKEANP
jgi:alkanesulfonate monooxygenase SsuD/methylene tetrahydromethanopterin reductase-like flavin-dependent oxidoreductase (luciferase family)